MSIVGLWSGKNYLKHAFMEADTMDKPSTSDGVLFHFSTKVIVHNLNYVPLVEAAYDPNNNGTIYPMIGQKEDDSFPSLVPFYFYANDITTTSVTFRAHLFGTLSGTFPIYYRIYRDLTQ